MRVLLDNDGYVQYWIWEDNGGIMTDEDIVIDAPEGVDDIQFSEEFFKYHIVDDVLVKDEAYDDNHVDNGAEEVVEPTKLDIIEAQVTYTAMMTNTLLEV